MKPFKWIKNHPLEAAALAAGAYFGGPALLGALGVGGSAAGAGMAAGEGAMLGGGLTAGSLLPGLDAVAGSSLLTSFPEITAPMAAGEGAMAGPGLAASDLASKPWLNARQSILLGQMAGQMGDQQRPMGAPMIEAVPPMARQGMRTQEEITKAWLLKNDPATYARMYGPPPGAQGGMYG